MLPCYNIPNVYLTTVTTSQSALEINTYFQNAQEVTNYLDLTTVVSGLF